MITVNAIGGQRCCNADVVETTGRCVAGGVTDSSGTEAEDSIYAVAAWEISSVIDRASGGVEVAVVGNDSSANRASTETSVGAMGGSTGTVVVSGNAQMVQTASKGRTIDVSRRVVRGEASGTVEYGIAGCYASRIGAVLGEREPVHTWVMRLQ